MAPGLASPGRRPALLSRGQSDACCLSGSGHHDKVPEIGRCKQMLHLRVLEAGSGKSECHGQVLVRAVFLACRMPTSSCVLICLRDGERERQREGETERESEHWVVSSSPYKGTNPIPSRGSALMTSSNPNYHPKIPYPNAITLGIGLHHMNLGQGETQTTLCSQGLCSPVPLLPTLWLSDLLPHPSESSWTEEFSLSMGNYKIPDVLMMFSNRSPVVN